MYILNLFYEIALILITQEVTGDKSASVKVMAWCRQPMLTQLYVATWPH